MGAFPAVSDGERSSHRLSISCLAVAVGVYLFFALTDLHLPGLEYDEVLFAPSALGKADGMLAWRIHWLGRDIPLMLMSYLGALKAWIYAPIFALFGGSPSAVRLPVVLGGVFSLAALFAAGRRMAGSNAAVIAALLLAADPTFIFASSRDWGPVTISLLLRVTGLYLYCRWLKNDDLWLITAAAFTLGLGTYDKVICIWSVVAMIAAAAVCHSSECRGLLKARVLAALVGSFALGALPLIAFNLTHRFATFKGHALITGHWHEYFVQRWKVFSGTLDGSMVYYLMNLSSINGFIGPGESSPLGIIDRAAAGLSRLLPIRGTFLPELLGLALISVPALWAARRLGTGRWLAFCTVQMVVICGFIAVIEEASGPHHMIMLYPYVQLVIAIVFSEVYGAAATLARPARTAIRSVAVLCLSATLLSQAVVSADYLRSFRSFGGAGAWSDAIYKLSEYARANSDLRYVLMDWGFSNQLLLLSDGHIVQEEAFAQFNGVSDSEKLRRLQPYLADRKAVLVFHAPGFETFPLVEWFDRIQNGSRGKIRLIKTIAQRDGRPIYLIYGNTINPD